MSKMLTVASEVQKIVFTQVLLQEMSTGFWKHARPADHAESWSGVKVVVGPTFGVSGFDVPRNYNFVNPDFFSTAEERLMEAAKTVNSEITVKQLKKQLISLNQIIGARLKDGGSPVVKLPRGRKQGAADALSARTLKQSKSNVRRVAANIAESAVPEEA